MTSDSSSRRVVDLIEAESDDDDWKGSDDWKWKNPSSCPTSKRGRRYLMFNSKTWNSVRIRIVKPRHNYDKIQSIPSVTTTPITETKKGRGRPRKNPPVSSVNQSTTSSSKRQRTSSSSSNPNIRSLDEDDDDDEDDNCYYKLYAVYQFMAEASPVWFATFNNDACTTGWQERQEGCVTLEAENQQMADAVHLLIEYTHVGLIRPSVLSSPDQLIPFIVLADKYRVEAVFTDITSLLADSIKSSCTLHHTIIYNLKHHPNKDVQMLVKTAVHVCIERLKDVISNPFPPTAPGQFNLLLNTLTKHVFFPLDDYVCHEKLMSLPVNSFVILMEYDGLSASNESICYITCMNYIQHNKNVSISNDEFISILSCIRFPLLSSVYLNYIVHDVSHLKSKLNYLSKFIGDTVDMANQALCYRGQQSWQQDIVKSSCTNNKHYNAEKKTWATKQLTKRIPGNCCTSNVTESSSSSSLYTMEFDVVISEYDLKLPDDQDGGRWASKNDYLRYGWKWQVRLRRTKNTSTNEMNVGVYLHVSPPIHEPSPRTREYATHVRVTYHMWMFNWSSKTWEDIGKTDPSTIVIDDALGDEKAFRSKTSPSFVTWRQLSNKQVFPYLNDDRTICFRVELYNTIDGL